jgi:type II secretory pathway pseudopilin PulG
MLTRTQPFCWTTAIKEAANPRSDATREGGVSLLELLVVLGIIGAVVGLVVPVTAGMIARAKADSTLTETVTWFETARGRASAERRNFEITFNSVTNRVKVERVEANLTKTVVVDSPLPGETQFFKFSGAPDTPDLFGNGAAIDFDGPEPHMFASDGTFVDANGDPSNGTIFIGKPGQNDTGRAITVIGATGLIRGWKLLGNGWQ